MTGRLYYHKTQLNWYFGGYNDSKFVNYIIYADELCVISLSSSGLQSLLNIYTDYCQLHDITLIVKKSASMFFRCSVNKQCGLSAIFINGTLCGFANEVKLRKSIYRFAERIKNNANNTCLL